MDFSLTEEQEAVRDLARQILGDVATPERHRQLEGADEWIDRKAWEALAGAGLRGIAPPVGHGGGGPGLPEVALGVGGRRGPRRQAPFLPSPVSRGRPTA